MLLILSPAKTLDETPEIPKSVRPTKPHFAADAKALAAQLAKLSEKQLGTLMDISPKLAALNAARFKHYSKAEAFPCAWMFRGDVYDGLDIDTLPAKFLPDLQARLRILSGLYGVLRPFDAMCPYRLEMGTGLKNSKGKNLYEFWGDRVAKELNKAARETDTDMLLNLASQEYAGVVNWNALKLTPISAQFKERKNGQVKMIALFAKRARGSMARWVIEHKAQAKDLKDFAEDGYRFDRKLSSNNELVFVRG